VTLKSGLEVTQDLQTGTIRKLGCGFLFVFHSNYGCVLHHFRDKTRYWSKIVICSYPLALDAPVRESPSEHCHPVWCKEIRVVGLPDGGKTLRIYGQTDSQTDGQTDGQTS